MSPAGATKKIKGVVDTEKRQIRLKNSIFQFLSNYEISFFLLNHELLLFWRRSIRVFWLSNRINLRIFQNRLKHIFSRYHGYEFVFHISNT